MLVALRGRENNAEDLFLAKELSEVARLADCPEAALIRDALKIHLRLLRSRLPTTPYSVLRLDIFSEQATPLSSGA